MGANARNEAAVAALGPAHFNQEGEVKNEMAFFNDLNSSMFDQAGDDGNSATIAMPAYCAVDANFPA